MSQTFQLTLQMSLKAIIRPEFLAEARIEAQAEDAPQFLKLMQAKFPEDDDQFMLSVVKNAMRTQVRLSTLEFMLRSGVGGSVSPVQIVESISLLPEPEEEPKLLGAKANVLVVDGDFKRLEEMSAVESKKRKPRKPKNTPIPTSHAEREASGRDSANATLIEV